MFSISKKLEGTLARTGRIETPHGVIETPAFIAVGTKATVKALTPVLVKDLGAQAVLANTYHLYLQPGSKLIREAGGLHKFMNWDGPIFTDSGGFQVFSLGAALSLGGSTSKVARSNTIPLSLSKERGEGEMRPPSPCLRRGNEGEVLEDISPLMRIDDEGVSFKSHIDGSEHRFTPEKSMQIQHDLGADIIFAFDECTSPQASDEYQREALVRTHAWAQRSLLEHKKLNTVWELNSSVRQLWGIVQGGRSEALRKESARTIGAMDFDGFGIGGSFDKEDMGKAVRWVNEILPEDKPRHLLGIGEPLDILSAVENGIDTFDCVTPTRWGRNGTLMTREGRLNIENAKHKNDFLPLETNCDCYTCQNFSKAYLYHLFKAKEMLAGTLASIHNLRFMMKMMEEIRQSIEDGTYHTLRQGFEASYV